MFIAIDQLLRSWDSDDKLLSLDNDVCLLFSISAFEGNYYSHSGGYKSEAFD